jgi:hypothetical protein
MMDAAALDEEESGDRSIQAASPKEETNGKKDIKGQQLSPCHCHSGASYLRGNPKKLPFH